jgi:hypothetical protein
VSKFRLRWALAWWEIALLYPLSIAMAATDWYRRRVTST